MLRLGCAIVQARRAAPGTVRSDGLERAVLKASPVTIDDVIACLEQIKALVTSKQFDLALALTEKLEARLQRPEPEDEPITPIVRELLGTSRQMTAACAQLQRLTVH